MRHYGRAMFKFGKNTRAILTMVAVWGILGSLVGAALFMQSGEVQQTDRLTPPELNLDAEHARGSSDVIVVEYLDYQCPACRRLHRTALNRLEDEYEYTYVVRHLPLPIHGNAQAAARAAEAAGALGDFWSMHERLFERQSEWENQSNPLQYFRRYAREIGLDDEAFVQQYRSDEIKKAVREDRESAQSLNISGTPTVYVNGRFTAPTYPGLSEAISAAQQPRTTRPGQQGSN